mmetsp:Transcript_56227/g.142503  ORF Transcript_56227/g.142503 Transcript_56227/m.142503 type:complete len:203 (+) Transcript_56227:1078-1686(+)
MRTTTSSAESGTSTRSPSRERRPRRRRERPRLLRPSCRRRTKSQPRKRLRTFQMRARRNICKLRRASWSSTTFTSKSATSLPCQATRTEHAPSRLPTSSRVPALDVSSSWEHKAWGTTATRFRRRRRRPPTTPATPGAWRRRRPSPAARSASAARARPPRAAAPTPTTNASRRAGWATPRSTPAREETATMRATTSRARSRG